MVLAAKNTLISVGAALFVLVAGSGCREDAKVNVATGLSTLNMPTMATRNISTLISDSGVTQYRIVAPLWEIYDEGAKPHWRFPEGIYLRKYDRKFNVIATVAADSAVYFKNERLWRLDGNVEITKVPRELFLTQQVFWNQNKGTVYSDSFIHIENATHVLEGLGFVSNDQFTNYRITLPTGIFPVDRSDINAKQGQSAAEDFQQRPQRPGTAGAYGSSGVTTQVAPGPEH